MNEWILLDKEKPARGQACLIFITYPEGVRLKADCRPLNRCKIDVCEWNGEYFWRGQRNICAYISHWMPLPKEPKNE